MKTKRLLIFVLCLVMFVASFAVIASAKGAETTTPYTETQNSDGTVSIAGYPGNLASKYASKDSYPFAVFKYKNGTYNSAEAGVSMGAAINLAKTWNTKNTPDGKGYTGDIYTATVVMRKNYTTVNYTATPNASKGQTGAPGDNFDNWAQNEGLITIDLNGYTLTQHKDTKGLFTPVTSKGSSSQGYIFSSIYTVKNGTLAVNTNPVIYANMWNSVYGVEGYSMADKDFTWNFDNVKFEYTASATETSMMLGYAGPQSLSSNPPSVAAPFYFNYTNCTFDITNSPAGTLTLFNAAPTEAQWLKVTVNVKGCEIVANANNAANLKLYAVESTYGSSVTFEADENGDVLTLVLPEGQKPAAPTATTFVNIDGKQTYWHEVDGKFVLTECVSGENVHACSCGATYTECVDENGNNVCDLCSATKIGGAWVIENAEGYPFVVLDAEGNYSSIHTYFKAAATAAAKINGSTILMRADYETISADASNNLKAVATEFTVDLNGYTLTRGYNGSYLFDNWCDAGTTADVAKVIIKNGTINAEKWLICLSGSNAIANAKQIDLTFDDVDFKFAANNDKTDGWVVTVHNQTYNKNITSNITFTDCTFDTTDMRSSIVIKNAPVLNLDTNNKDGVDYVKVNLTVNGGKIIANRFEKAAFYQVHSDDIVTFGKGSDDSYITLEMPNGKTPATPTDASYFTVGEEQLYFHKATVGETDTVYTLANHAVVEGTHYCSCGIEMTKCADETGDHKCDVCGEVISECVDEDKDHKCDICGLTSECVDEDKDHYCDLCEKKTECEDANNDHNCDLCKTPITECKDDDKNHNCDICGKELSECVDENKDEICDYCGYVINTYGIKNIDAKYASVQTYPFFVLRYENGVYKFSHAASTFYGAQAGASAIGHAIYSVLRDTNKYDLENGVYVPAKEGGSVVTAVVVMRRDYDLKSGAEYHNNIAHAQGTVIIDLNGHALNEAAGSTKSIFTATVKGWPDDADKVYTFPSTFTFKNGKINVLKYAAAAVGTTDAITEKKPAAFIENSVLTINYEGVTFGLLAGATTTNFAYSTGNSTNNYPSVAKVNVNYKDCVFDLKTNAITTNINIFNNDTTGKDVDCDIVIEGCEIIASSMANVKVANTSTTNGTSLTAKKNENGKYLTLTMPTGSTAPEITNTVMIDSGAICAFVKTSETVENANYTLYPAVMVGYKIKTSVTLYSNFVYNVYIPKANVDSFTINGAAMNYEEVELDGVTYYHVAVNLPAGETLQDIKVCVSLVSGETTVNANWTLSTLKYTKSVLAGEYNDVTKTLMKDMLVYAAAAHTYFENTEKVAEKLSEVAALLEGYTKEMPEGEAKKPTDKTYFTDVTVYLGEVPSFRFTLAEGYTADNFTFKVGTRDATVTAGEGYVEVAMYAYMMLDDVIFTVNGTEVAESYNLYAYYEYANTLNNDNLNAIVEALMKYSAAAEAYRVDFVANYCAHDYVSGVCTKCGKGDPDVGTMTLTAPSSIYSNYAGKDITVTFSKEWYNGEVTFTTDNENVFVENGKIFAKGTFASEVGVTVTAKTEHHTASVVVNVSTFNGGISAERKVQYYENNIIKEENKGGMIFVGDSYFDGENAYPNGSGAFWRDFYQDWAGQKAYLMGMSSAQIDDLEVVSERIVYPMEPTEIVIHIGHNDIHHGPLTVDEFIARLTALVNEYHSKLPEAQIYWLSVDPKRDSADPTNQRHESSFVEAPAVNAAMAALSESTEWFTYVDTTSIFYTKNTAGELTAVNKNMYPSSDASHPTLVAYDLIRIKIEEARGKTFDNVININNVDNHYSIGKGGKTYNVNGDFVISGRLVMTQFVKNNSHLQFSFGTATGNNRPYRFLLWDASSDGKFGIGYEKIGSYTDENASGKTLYDATNGLVINWTVVVKDGDAYWFVGGKLQAVFEDVALSGTFNIDACGMDAVLYDINLVERTAENEAAYNQYIYPYFADDVANIEMNGQNGDITAAGKTFTDAAGNNLTNNYIVTGKLDIQNFGKSNPHIQFRVGPNYRFLLWDSNRDGKFGAGYTEGSSSASDTKEGITLYNAIGGITFDWAVVVNEGKAYWYLNGKLEKTFEAPTLQAFNLGALQADAYFYDIEICTKAENPELFGLILGEYNGSTVYVNNYKCASGTNISNTGKTFTVDTNGTAISGNYVARGSLRTTAINLNNAHIQFKVKDGYRFLLWDNDNDGKFGAGRIASGSTQISDKTTGAYIIDATENGLELEWAVIVKDGMAYFFIDGVLRVTFAVTGSTSFNIGALQIDVMFYNIEIYVDDTSNASDNYDQVVAGYEIPNN